MGEHLRKFRGLMVASAVSMTAICGSIKAQVADGPAAAPIPIFEFSEKDYPLQSLAAHEEGSVGLIVTIDARGRVTDTQITKSSGFPLLDATTGVHARDRWMFEPDAQNSGERKLEVRANWAFRQLAEYKLASDPLPEGIEPPKPITSHAVTAYDYPPESLRAGEQGTVAVKYLINERGDAANAVTVQSSGFPRLDEAAIRFASRWKFEPAKLNGMPVPVTQTVTVMFGVIGPRLARKKCYPAPVVGFQGTTEDVLISGVLISANTNPQPMTWHNRWVEVDADGKPISVIVDTEKGKVLIPNGHLQRMGQMQTYPKPRAEGPCWYNDPFATRDPPAARP